MPDTLYIVVPCYNEEDVLPEAIRRLEDKLLRLIGAGLANENSRLLFVDDGSTDKTWEIIEAAHNTSAYNTLTQSTLKHITGIKLSRNKGHQNALIAGLMTAMGKADVTISIDADLQDDIECMDGFLQNYKNGCDIVYGVRSNRKKDSIFKRATAQVFYKLMKWLGVNITYNHADYRLMSKKALEHLSDFKEVNLFLRGIVPLIGFKTATVNYEREKRFAGESKYPVRKMLSFAWDGITSFSVRPIRLVAVFGFIAFLVSIGLMIKFLVDHILGYTVSGWSTLAISIWLIGGLQLLALGMIGEYIGKIYSEVKSRPKYIIEKVLE
ncbi:MAG: glycosyltransferase family 2 protein [Oscillospiraceae bacterium]|nr:glycosyltransferase family 2 protein [Oscillospiraceae bacterium]